MWRQRNVLYMDQLAYQMNVIQKRVVGTKSNIYASDKVYQLLAHDRWFSPGTPASSTTKTGRHDITEILLKVALNTIKQTNNIKYLLFFSLHISHIIVIVSKLQWSCVLCSPLLFVLLECCRHWLKDLRVHVQRYIHKHHYVTQTLVSISYNKLDYD